MGLVNLEEIELNLPGRILFSGLSLTVFEGDRIGLIGRNGTGKSTLLKIIKGDIEPDRGKVSRKKGIRTGYLPQEVHDALSGPILQAIVDSIPERKFIKERIESIKDNLSRTAIPDHRKALEQELAIFIEKINEIDMRFPIHNAERILKGLGFESHRLNAPYSSLSGGWKMRANLASILYRDPDLLLLDEPTNHLDIPSLTWLDEFLQNHKGTIIMVCHDREFLNKHINRVLSLEPGGIKYHKGNYESYLRAREQELRLLESKKKKIEHRIRETRRFIDRFRAKASKASLVQSRIKSMERLTPVNLPNKEKNIRFSFPEIPRSGRIVLEINSLAKAFGGNLVFHDLNLQVLRGERIALIGPIGSGKTTLLKILAGIIEPDHGHIRYGHGVCISYYAQEQSELLNQENSIIEEIHNIVPKESTQKIRNLCGSFLFSGDEVEKKIKVLSGGERARVCLAKILVKPGNLLLMDEPTNHLDMFSSDVLASALKDYRGTMIFVSHNRAFINALATRIWELKDKTLIEFPGNLTEYEYHQRLMEQKELAQKRSRIFQRENNTDKQDFKSSNRKLQRKIRAEKRKTITEAIGPIEERIKRLEDQITGLENEERQIEEQLNNPEIFKDKEKAKTLVNRYREIKNAIEELIRKWEKSHQELEDTKKELGLI